MSMDFWVPEVCCLLSFVQSWIGVVRMLKPKGVEDTIAPVIVQDRSWHQKLRDGEGLCGVKMHTGYELDDCRCSQGGRESLDTSLELFTDTMKAI